MGGTNEGHHKEHERPGQRLPYGSPKALPGRFNDGLATRENPISTFRANKKSFYKSVEIRGRHLGPQDSYLLICFMTVDGCC